MLGQLGIQRMKRDPQYSYKEIAEVEMIQLETWENHYDADGNNASISTHDIQLQQAPTYKCDSEGDFYPSKNM